MVACDNCTDNTARIAVNYGADDVFNTYHNHGRKAGALNQALKYHINWHQKNMYVLIMDADTMIINPKCWFNKAVNLIYPNRPRLSKEALNKNYLQRKILKLKHPAKYREMYARHAYDCVGSIFQAPTKLSVNNTLTEGQKLEWEGYADKIERRRRVYVLTGTCSLFSALILRKIYKMHHYKYFYDEKNLTEDFMMTISVKKVGARIISPTACLCYTAVKSTIPSLLRQRRRWYTGALQTLAQCKLDRVTLPYLGQQIMLFISTFAFLLSLIVSVYLYLTGNVFLNVFWSFVFLGYDADQVIRVWKYGSRFDKLYSASMIPCLYYSIILQIAYIWSLYTFINGKHIYWNSSHQKKSS